MELPIGRNAPSILPLLVNVNTEEFGHSLSGGSGDHSLIMLCILVLLLS
jgi:hypothetical protein